MSAQPEIGGRAPLAIDVEAGKSYEWKADQAARTWFCACKRTGNRPMCDGSHKTLAP
jgi:CDGSH-type Zn-finger protein